MTRSLRSALTLLCLFPLPVLGQVVRSFPPSPVTVADAPDFVLLQSLLVARKPALVFRSGDVLTVNVFGMDTFADNQQVAQDGTVVFPLVGRTQVAGLTIEQLQASIAANLAAKGMVREAQVSITVDQRPSDVVSVLGNVNKPGVYPAVEDFTLGDFLSEAGGFIESAPNTQSTSAASYTVTLTRPSLGAPVRIPLGPRTGEAAWSRIPLFAGDQIRVDKVGVVYAVGAFRNQGGFQLKNNTSTTIMQLIALAGGIGFEGSPADSHIVRRSTAGATTIVDINVKRILKGQDPDVALQPEDVLLVPTNELKAAIKGGGPSIIVSVVDALFFSNR